MKKSPTLNKEMAKHNYLNKEDGELFSNIDYNNALDLVNSGEYGLAWISVECKDTKEDKYFWYVTK